MHSTNTQYDLIIVGDPAIDVLEDFKPSIRRPGGAFYSALAAATLKLRVGIIGTSIGDVQNEFVSRIESFGIDTTGIQPAPNFCIEYHLRNINEIFPQVLVNEVFRKPIAAKFPESFINTQSVLIYPVGNSDLLYEIAFKVKRNGGLVCLDLQHDQTELESLIKLLEIVDIIFASRDELLKITHTTTDMEALKKIWTSETKLVVIKYGMGGSKIYEDIDKSIQIAAFIANFKCTIGAGDTYNAVFISSFIKDQNIEEAGIKASLAASIFSEKIEFPEFYLILKNLNFLEERQRRARISAHPEQLASLKIYLAGSFLSIPMRNWIDNVTLILESRGFSVFSPYRDAGLLSSHSSLDEKRRCFELDVENLKASHIIVATLDTVGRGGTNWEIGYAYSKGIPVFALLTDTQLPISNMIFQSCKSINSDPAQLLNDIFEYITDQQIL